MGLTPKELEESASRRLTRVVASLESVIDEYLKENYLGGTIYIPADVYEPALKGQKMSDGVIEGLRSAYSYWSVELVHLECTELPALFMPSLAIKMQPTVVTNIRFDRKKWS